MASINASTAGVGGVITTADNTGILNIQTAGTTAVTVNASQNVGLGVTPSASSVRMLQGPASLVVSSQGDAINIASNAYFNSGWKYSAAASTAATNYVQTSSQHIWYNAPNGTAGNAITFTQAMTLDASGNLIVGDTSTAGNFHKLKRTPTENAGNGVLSIDSASSFNTLFYAVTGTGYSVANTGIIVRKDTGTNRSINAAGTINASGADYAEYMTKANSFTLAKGDVVGIDANGKLTNVFADAMSFVVKSTDPSYVGGDTWGNEEAIGKKPDDDASQEEKDAFEAALEAARQLVDRIAFAGQVPVNVLGATSGQYIIPVNDNGAIKGEAVTSPTFEQYQSAVGKVIAIEADGRARIIVKVA